MRAFWSAYSCAAVLALLALSTCHLSAAEAHDRIRPNLAWTPGVVRPLSTATVCATKWGKDQRHVTERMKRAVFAQYGVALTDRHDYEVDHLVSRELGGADAVANLWPQPYWTDWNAHEKDRLENRLHRLVCAGQLTLPAAQTAIRTDWVRAYRQYVGEPELQK